MWTYYGTTDTLEEVEGLATLPAPLPGKFAAGPLTLCSVAGGMSGLSLLLPLKGRLSAVTFFDYNPKAVAVAELWVTLMKLSPTRRGFLRRLYARGSFTEETDITPENMQSLIVDSAFDQGIVDDTDAQLICEGSRQGRKQYIEDVMSLLALHPSSDKPSGEPFPRMWPAWRPGLDKKHFGYLTGDPGPGKVGTLWFGQAGLMKTEARYRQTRQMLQSMPINYRVLDLNSKFSSRDLGLTGQPAVLFTSNALTLSKWVKGGDIDMDKRLSMAFPQGVLRVETTSVGDQVHLREVPSALPRKRAGWLRQTGAAAVQIASAA